MGVLLGFLAAFLAALVCYFYFDISFWASLLIFLGGFGGSGTSAAYRAGRRIGSW